jgi:hypothetical protein
MVDTTLDRPIGAPAIVSEPWRLRWGAIFGGAFVALAIWFLLYVFGLAVGLISVDGETGRFHFPGLFIGIWAVISPIVALLVGGWVAARTAGPQDRVSGSLHGVVLWGFTTVLGVFAIWMLVSSIISGAMGLGQAVAGAIGHADGQMMNVQSQQLLEPINKRLTEAGQKPLTPEQLQATMKDVANRAAREGTVNRQMIEDALVANTGLQRQDVQQIAADIEQQVQQGLKEAQATAAKAAEQAGRAMWGLFFILLLSLIAAIVGAALGASGRR